MNGKKGNHLSEGAMTVLMLGISFLAVLLGAAAVMLEAAK